MTASFRSKVRWRPSLKRWPLLLLLALTLLTSYHFAARGQQPPSRTANAKVMPLNDGSYLALWEEHLQAGTGWHYRTTRATRMVLDSSGKQIKSKHQVELPGVRLGRSDELVKLMLGGIPHAVWISTDKDHTSLTLWMLDGDLRLKSRGVELP